MNVSSLFLYRYSIMKILCNNNRQRLRPSLAATSGSYCLLALLLLFTFNSCDCVQKAAGVVLDKQTKKPVANVSLGKYEKEDTATAYSARTYTDSNGKFEYSSISGGLSHCSDLELYFQKPGYKAKKMTFESASQDDTVYLDKIPFSRDAYPTITPDEFDKQIEECISLLQTKQLKDISDEEHIEIMMCLNTIFMRDLKGGHYDQLNKVSEDKNYVRDIIKVYKEWIPNRGMGYYFPKLQMELYGTPMPYAVYNITQ